MARATKSTIEALEPWLDQVRRLGIDGLVETSNSAFYRKRVAILHFHQDATGIQADVKVQGDWRRVAIDDAAGKREVMQLLRTEYVAAGPPSA